MKMIVARFKEPSTWSTLFAAATAVGISIDPGLAQQVTIAGAGVAGLLGVVLPEGK